MTAAILLLALVTAEHVDPRIERCVGALGRLGGQGASDQGGLEQRLCLEQSGQGDHVGGEGHRLGVEIAAGQGLAGVCEDQRVVGDPVGLVAECRRGLTQDIEGGAHHLGLAAQAIGVLHPLIVL